MVEAVATSRDDLALAHTPAFPLSKKSPSVIVASNPSKEAAWPNCPQVLVVGPSTELIGGMSTVVAQQLALDMNGTLSFSLFSLSIRANSKSVTIGSLRRHLNQLRQYRASLIAFRPVAVHLHTCSGFSFFHTAILAWIARRLHVKVVLHIHGAAFDQFFAKSGAIARRMIRRTLAKADAVVALSREWRERIAAMSPNAKITVIENAVEVQPLVERPQKDGPCRFLLLASMDEWKGIDDLLDASALVKDSGAMFELVLAGPEGSAGDARTLQKKIEQRGLANYVRYVGPVPPESKTNWYEWADVYVQPSRHEGMPMAVLEAMAAGLPVIATRVGALPEVVNDRASGLLVDAQTPPALATAMQQLAKDSATRRHYGRAGHEIVAKRFGVDRFRNDLLKLYAQVGS